MKQTYFFLSFALASITSLKAETWIYSEWYPWMWLPQSSSWIYIPNAPQKVWEKSTAEWINNPMLSNTFDITPNFTNPLQQLTLDLNSSNSLILDYNLSGIPHGYLAINNSSTVDAVYKYNYDPINGTAFLYIEWHDLSGDGSIAVQLHFNSFNKGSFTLLGNLGLSSCSVCEFFGDFSITSLQ